MARGGGLGISAHPLEESAKDHQGPEVGHLLGTLGSWTPPPRTQRLKRGGGGEVGDTAVLDGRVCDLGFLGMGGATVGGGGVGRRGAGVRAG